MQQSMTNTYTKVIPHIDRHNIISSDVARRSYEDKTIQLDTQNLRLLRNERESTRDMETGS